MNWFMVNAVLPVGLPLGLLLLAKLARLKPPYRARLSLLKSVQDGQLYWLAMGFSASCLYDLAQAKSLPASLTYVDAAATCILGASAVLVFLGLLFPFEAPVPAPEGWWAHVGAYRMLAGSVCALAMISSLWLAVHLVLTDDEACVKTSSIGASHAGVRQKPD